MSEPTTQDVEAWAKQFDVTVTQIRDAIKEVGPVKSDVELYLKGSRSSTEAEATRKAG